MNYLKGNMITSCGEQPVVMPFVGDRIRSRAWWKNRYRGWKIEDERHSCTGPAEEHHRTLFLVK